MNDLNSCLLSGTVTSITNTENYTDFELEVTRFEHDAEGILIEVISVVFWKEKEITGGPLWNILV